MYDSDSSVDRDRRSAIILRAAAIYIERHGYYMPRYRMLMLLDPDMTNPDFGWDNESTFDDDDVDRSRTGPNPPVSDRGAIAMVVFGWPNTRPADDNSNAYLDFCEAVGAFDLFYALDGAGCWLLPRDLATDLRAAADDCDYRADQATRLRHTWGD